MENNKTIIDPVDEALRLVYLNANSEQSNIDLPTELNHLINTQYSVQVSLDEGRRMVNSLYEKLAVDSLGILISKAMEKEGLNIEEIAIESGLPTTSIEQLQADLILANSIPVISFKALLKKLQIPFDKAKEAITKTFHILKSEMDFSPSTISSMQLAFRRRNTKDASSFSLKASKSENQYLFQNEEALNKYLNRLGELYNAA